MSTLLGFLDSKIKNEFTGEAWRTNKIGGHLCAPASMKEEELNELKRLMNCEKCNDKMIFIGQICCPLEIDNYDRFLILFACNTLKCNQWSVIRYLQTPIVKSKSKEASPSVSKAFEEENSWLNDQSDWNDDEILSNEKIKEEKNLIKEEMVDEKNEFVILNEDATEFIQPYYLEVELEDQTENSIKLDSHVDELLKNYKLKESTEKKNNDKDTNEYSKIDETDILDNYNNDVLTYRFYKKLKLASSQVIRYSWNQAPLLNSSNINLDERNCNQCGSSKVFELQLMPALINYLRFENSNQLNLDFASVLIFTCKQNCSIKMLTKESYLVLEENDPNIPDCLLK